MDVFTSIPIKLELDAVLQRMQVRNRSERFVQPVEDLLEVARPLVRPKAIYDVAYVDQKTEDSIEIGGIRFTSRVLAVNLKNVDRVFPYVVTCGRELEEVDLSASDGIRWYYLDQIKETAVVLARQYLEDHVKRRYALGQLSRMAPGAGSAADWPISQQEGLFSLLGGTARVEALIGVTLTDHFIMMPIKSVSGIFFSTEVKFESCQICPREHCRGRRAPYDPRVAKKYRPKEA